MDIKETGCKDGRCMELVHEDVHWWNFVLVMMNFGFC